MADIHPPCRSTDTASSYTASLGAQHLEELGRRRL